MSDDFQYFRSYHTRKHGNVYVVHYPDGIIQFTSEAMIELCKTVTKYLHLCVNHYYGCYSEDDIKERTLHHIATGCLTVENLIRLLETVDEDYGKRVVDVWNKTQGVDKKRLPPLAIEPVKIVCYGNWTGLRSEDEVFMSWLRSTGLPFRVVND